MVPRVGQRIGPYEILGRLGSGGMGLVFSAWDARLQRDVAIKLLREEYGTPTMRSRFLQEARAASGLNHPNICTIFDIGDVSGDPFLVMELLKGETLRTCISRRGKLPAEDIHRIATEVLDGLALAHARGVIHRDIKPANIILVNKPGGGFQAKVLDFGLAKIEMGEEESSRFDLTTIGTTVGTVSYMSPEQARGEVIDARSDLFSLGAVLYEAATGELPFQGATSALVFVELLGKPPAPIRPLNPAIPKDLDRIILRLLAKNRGDRFQSATAALEALETVSFRKSPLGGISLWASKSAAKPRSDAPAAPGPSGPDTAPGPPAAEPARSPVDTGTVLRPARRAPADPLSPRTANSPAPPSPFPVLDRAGAPLEPAAAQAASLRSSAQGMGEVVLRPLKPEPLRQSLPPREGRAPNSSAEPRPESSPVDGAAAETQSPVPAMVSAELPLVAAAAEIRDPFKSAHDNTSGPGDSPPPGPAQIITVTRPDPSTTLQEEPGTPVLMPKPQSGNTQDPDRSRAWWIVGAAALLVAAAIAWYFNSRAQPVVSTASTILAVGSMQNRTGDSSLAGVLAAGFNFAAAQSPSLALRSEEDYRSGLRATGHDAGGELSLEQALQAARAVGAQVLVLGNIHSVDAAYELSLQLYNAGTGARVANISETASSREQITDAIDRLASDLRSTLGETSDSIGRTAVPLGKEATANLDALGAFASGASLEAAGSSAEAMLAYQRAARFEPHFTQAYLRLADIYREQHAELAAARAATQAQANSAGASSRTQWLARASDAINAAGDYPAANEVLTRLLAQYPGDLTGLDDLALAQLLGGKFTDAQATAAHVLQLFRFDRQAGALAELALIAQGRPEAVAAAELQAQAAGAAHPGIATLAAAAGAGAKDMLLPASDRPLAPAVAASLLDAAGHFSEGAARWQALAELAQTSPELSSAAAYAYGTSALDRALAGECKTALPLAQQAQALPSGAAATFGAGEAEALCDNLDGARRSLASLKGAYSQGSAARAYLAPDLDATIAWKSGDTTAALHTLDATRQFDPVSLTGYLRGLVELSAHQPQLGIVQFQAILSHRGPVTLFNPEVYPMAQFALARSYAAGEDAAGSSAAYARFLNLWSSADPGVPAVAEARAHTHP